MKEHGKYGTHASEKVQFYQVPPLRNSCKSSVTQHPWKYFPVYFDAVVMWPFILTCSQHSSFIPVVSEYLLTAIPVHFCLDKKMWWSLPRWNSKNWIIITYIAWFGLKCDPAEGDPEKKKLFSLVKIIILFFWLLLDIVFCNYIKRKRIVSLQWISFIALLFIDKRGFRIEDVKFNSVSKIDFLWKKSSSKETDNADRKVTDSITLSKVI